MRKLLRWLLHALELDHSPRADHGSTFPPSASRSCPQAVRGLQRVSRVSQFEEETSQGDGIAEEHWDGYQGAKSVLVRTAPDQPQWENAQIEIHELLTKASEVPGLTATLDELRGKLLQIAGIINALHNGDDGELTPGQARKVAIDAIGDVLGEPF